MSLIARFRFTLIAFVVGGLLIVLALFTQFNLVRTGLEKLEGIEGKDVDDLLVAILLLVVGIVVDAVMTQRRAQMEARQLETLQATMRTVQDLVGNALNNLLLFRMEAEDHVSPEALKQFDDIVHGTAQKLVQLGSVKAVVQKPLASGPGIQYEAAAPE
jgi:hypothetical protein